MILNLLDRMKLPFRKNKEFLSALYDILGFYPHNLDIYRIAFSHKSLGYQRDNDVKAGGKDRKGGAKDRRKPRTENTSKPLNNERLEYLGDAVLESVVSDILFRHFPHKREGFLTSTRSKIVQREALNRLAADMGLEKLILAAQGTRMAHTNIGGNAFEALMGAIYLDRGYKHCHWFISNRVVGRYVDLENVAQKEVNFKSKLLEWSQKNRINISFKDSADDNKGFKTIIVMEGITLARGNGRSKKESQQEASKEALTRMRREPKTYDNIFRAKEKRTAMEAEESFALPKIDEIETSLTKGRKTKNAKNDADAPVLEDKKQTPQSASDAAYDTAYDETATFEVIDTPPEEPQLTAEDYEAKGLPAPPEEDELRAADEKLRKKRTRNRGAKTVGDAVKGVKKGVSTPEEKAERREAERLAEVERQRAKAERKRKQKEAEDLAEAAISNDTPEVIEEKDVVIPEISTQTPEVIEEERVVSSGNIPEAVQEEEEISTESSENIPEEVEEKEEIIPSEISDKFLVTVEEEDINPSEKSGNALNTVKEEEEINPSEFIFDSVEEEGEEMEIIPSENSENDLETVEEENVTPTEEVAEKSVEAPSALAALLGGLSEHAAEAQEVENNIPTETEQDFIIKEDISPIIEEPTDEDADNEVNNETNNEIAEEDNNDVSDVEEETTSTTDHLDTEQQEVDANKSDEAETEVEVKTELPVEPKTETKAEAEVETKLASTLPPISLDAIVFGTENDEHMGFMHDDDIYFDSDTNVQTEEAEQDLNASETFNAQKTADNSAQTKKKQKRRHRPAQTAPQNGKESKGNNGKAKKQGEQTPQSNAKPAKNNAKAARTHAPKAQTQPNAPKEDGNAPQTDAKQRANYKRNNRRRRPNKGKQNNNPEAPVA